MGKKAEKRDLYPHKIMPRKNMGKAEVWYYRDRDRKSVAVYVQPGFGKTIVFRILDRRRSKNV